MLMPCITLPDLLRDWQRQKFDKRELFFSVAELLSSPETLSQTCFVYTKMKQSSQKYKVIPLLHLLHKLQAIKYKSQSLYGLSGQQDKTPTFKYIYKYGILAVK